MSQANFVEASLDALLKAPSGALNDAPIIVFTGNGLSFNPAVATLLEKALPHITRAAAAADYTAKAYSTLEILAPEGLTASRLILVGLGKAEEQDKLDDVRLGGVAFGALPKNAKAASLILERPEGFAATPEKLADVELGARLRSYRFEQYRTKRKEGEEAPLATEVALLIKDVTAYAQAAHARRASAQGVFLARTLVNEPCNILGPAEFAAKAAELRTLGVEVEIFKKAELEKIGMRALLGVAQGSTREAHVAVMRWNGGKAGDAPLALIGKGVTFDTGGISIKPAQNMEDMKGDMAGAAAVLGAMHALAARKASANVVAAIGLVENMPDGNAQRPGDIVTSLSGQTIEIINTDAEGRLVLGDLLWYMQERFKPTAMINLATLTGAILVALAQEYAGLFSNNDALAEKLTKAGQGVNERLWRLPMGPEFDKMIDSRFADMKNTGGRFGGSITAAQFLERFVNKVPWAHLDIAGVAMDSPASDINKGWASGFGVRLLDRLVRDHYETQ